MTISTEVLFSWARFATFLVAGLNLLFGIFSACWPGRSILLYEGLMARLNWQVEPIDEAREVRNTRLLATVLILLNLLVLGMLIRGRI